MHAFSIPSARDAKSTHASAAPGQQIWRRPRLHLPMLVAIVLAWPLTQAAAPISCQAGFNPGKAIKDAGKQISNGGKKVTDAAKHFDEERMRLQREAEKRAKELDRQRLEAERRLQAQYQELRAKVRESTSFSSNQGQVQASLRQNGWQVAFGKLIGFEEYHQFTVAVAASVATENPAPVMMYIEYIVAETKRELAKNLRGEARKTIQRFEHDIIMALDQAIKTGRTTDFTLEGVDLRIGVATYNNWKKISGDYPKIDRGHISWDHLERQFPLPNTHHPYVAYRVRYHFAGGQVSSPQSYPGQNVSSRSEPYGRRPFAEEQPPVPMPAPMPIPTSVPMPVPLPITYRHDVGSAKSEANVVPVTNVAPSPSRFERPMDFATVELAGQSFDRLGIRYITVPQPDGTFALRITATPTFGSPAAQLGLETGDTIVALDGIRFRSHADVINHVEETKIDFIDGRTGQFRTAMIFLR